MKKYIIFVMGLVIVSIIEVAITGLIDGADMMVAIIAVVVGAVLTLGLFAFIMQPMLSRLEILEAAKKELDVIRREQEKKRDKTIHPAISDQY